VAPRLFELDSYEVGDLCVRMHCRPEWADEGKEPDYRFSLANERTFLAYIRTGGVHPGWRTP